MNPFSKALCRAVQLGFRIAMPVLPYREPKCFHSVQELAQPLQQLQIRSVLLVTDSFLRSSGATKTLEDVLHRSGIRCAVFDQVQPNPTVHNVENALKLYRRAGCQGLIAFGGGSAIDCAKAVGARVVCPKKKLNRLKGLLRVLRKLPPLIAIPTTAGTGSEVTVTAVITDGETKHKYTMNNFTFIPTYAVHDPAVTYTLPPHLTATTGMDALTHAVEAYIGRSTSKETRRLAKEAVKLVFENLETAYRDGNDRLARQNMLRAAYAAGIAFSKSYVGYIHAVAHTLGGQYNIPHGLTHQDWRYTMLHQKNGVFYPMVNFLGIHLVPTLIVYGCVLPAAYAMLYDAPFNMGSVVFFCLSVAAVTLQGTADFQMHRFRKKKTGGFIHEGLWKYSRHPNYLGEILMWWGVALAVICAFPGEWYLCAGAAANTVLFLTVSIPMADNRQSAKPGFAEYKKQTRMLLPIRKIVH